MIKRTAMITAGSIAGVVLAGGIAAGTNIGILRAADESPLGELSAQAPIAAPVEEESSLPAPAEPLALEPSAIDAADAGVSSTVVVDEAGELDIVATSDSLSLGAARPNAGWTWEEVLSDGDALVVAFTSDGQRLEVTARRSADDTIAASVQRVAVGTSTPPPVAQSTSGVGGDDDHDEYEDDDHDEDEDRDGDDDEYEDDEYEDDEYEHEGGDDDD